MKKTMKKLACAVLTLTVVFSTACGVAGPQGVQGITPKLRISETTNEWEVSYDEGATWTSLGVKATGEQGATGANGAAGENGSNGTKVEIGENGNWFLDGVDTGVKASCDCGTSNPPPTPNPDPAPTEFVPVTRFVVTSDVHYRENGAYESQARLNAVFDTAYEYAESQTDYAGLDGIFFVGDQTNNGSEAEQKAFFNTVSQKVKGDTVVRAVMGNHEYYATGHYTAESMAQAPLNFIEWAGYDDEDAHLIIDGYHYIFASMDKYRGNTGKENEFLSPTKLAWLESELDEAVAADPTGEKPIFVFQHVGADNTILGSTGRGGDIALRELLNDYPNVVDFSGHTHYSILDPRSIWQGEFTAFGTGAMSYLGIEMNGGYYVEQDETGELVSSTETGLRNGNMYYVCEISADNEMRVLRYDAINEAVYGEPYYLDSFGTPSNFKYTDARKDASIAPHFETGDKINFTLTTDKKIEFTFPQASGKDFAHYYRVELYNGESLIKTEYKHSRFHMASKAPTEMSVALDGLVAETEYTVKVFPVNSYAKVGEPLIAKVSTQKATVINYYTLADFTDENSGTICNVDGYGYGSTKEQAYRMQPTYSDGTVKAGFYLDRYHADGGSTKLAAFTVTMPTGLDLSKDGIVIRVRLIDKTSSITPDRFTLLTKAGQKTWQTKASTDFPGVTMPYQEWMEVKISSSDLEAMGYANGDTTLYFGGWITASKDKHLKCGLWFQVDEIKHYEQIQ